MTGRGIAPHLLGALALGLAACAGATDPIGSQEQMAQPIDRLLIGQAVKYPADLTLRPRERVLQINMAERRKAAWEVVARAIAPVEIAAEIDDPSTGGTKKPSLPRFQTWYSREDVFPMFDRLFRGLGPEERRQRASFSAEALAEVFPWNATMATSLASFTQERLEARRQELATESGVHSLGKDSRVLMSPEYVEHLFDSYQKLIDCPTTDTGSGVPAGDTSSFAPCLKREFPPSAVSIKTRWMPGSAPLPTFDTSASGIDSIFERGTFGDGDGEASPDDASAYTMQIGAGVKKRLVALHIVTKELKDWTWITLWWSPTPNEDFGADRPETIRGAFANYKMCVVTAFDELDANPASGFEDKPSLAAALTAAAKHGPSTWCSNPYLEIEERAATTNCIGCHQHGGTGETTDTVLADPTRFPDSGRKQVRQNFPVDYQFTTHGGLEIASEMRARAEALSPSGSARPSAR